MSTMLVEMVDEQILSLKSVRNIPAIGPRRGLTVYKQSSVLIINTTEMFNISCGLVLTFDKSIQISLAWRVSSLS